ncbi:hypothetical protein KEM56_007599 [Ascosphaera pollenicola]|nr:hypothetical protein KEM56_007599 [Ascosphaera pollenicola]
MDALSREERRLMRQRGAGNRAGKAVDFGFSFGSPPPVAAVPEKPPTPAPAPAPAPPSSLQTNAFASTDAQAAEPAGFASSARQKTPNGQLISPAQIVRRQTPTSSRLTPVRKTPTPTKSRTRTIRDFGESSPYDIPRDEETDREREANAGDGPSSKRRRVSHEGLATTRDSAGLARETSSQASPVPAHVTESVGAEARRSSDRTRLSPMINVTITSPNQSSPERNTGKEPQQEASTAEEKRVTSFNLQAPLEPPEIQDTKVADDSRGRRRTEDQVTTTTDGHDYTHGMQTPAVEEQGTSNQIARDVGNASISPVPDRHDQSIDDTIDTSGIQGHDATRGPGKTVAESSEDATKQTANESMVEAQPTDTTKSTKPGLRERVKNTVQNSVSRVVDRFRKRKRGADGSKVKEVLPQQQQQQQQQQARKDKMQHEQPHRKPRATRESDHEVQGSEVDNEVIDTEFTQPVVAPGEAPDTQVSSEAQGRRLIAKKKTRRPADNDEDGTRPKRQPAVPVTVNRFSNFLALDPQETEDTGEQDDTSTLEQRRKVALQQTRRSGVNPVDVLNQICRETFDDALSTLQETFTSEPDKKARADIVRKIKALQAFNAELEHRLFDIREVLDANHTLAAQLRREKRDVAILRADLLDLRRQRNEIELEMDEIRQSFMAEQEQTNRQVTLTNAIHELELALERSKEPEPDHDHEPEDPAAGLEFLLRSVADNVSSATPDSQGGLLRQIKAFNDQLEQVHSALEQGSG